MSDPFNDDELDRQLATRLTSRGWTVTPPKGAKPPPAPKPDIQIGLLAAQTNIPFSDIRGAGGWEAIETSLTKSVQHAHAQKVLEAATMSSLFWRGWRKDNTLEQMIGLTVLPYIENYDPKKHRPWGSPCVMSVPVPKAGTSTTYSTSRLDQLKPEEQARLNIYNAISAEQAQRKYDPSLSMSPREYWEKYGDQFVSPEQRAMEAINRHRTLFGIPNPQQIRKSST